MIELEHLCRAEWGRLLAALIHALGDFDLAEEALQDAFAKAVAEWGDHPPGNARGWLYTAARHRAIDLIRRRRLLARKLDELSTEPEERPDAEENLVPDERLRLIFTCCHPALSTEAQVALTLRTLCGLSTEEIARAFLVPVPTMAQRLVRAKAKIREAGIPYVVPSEENLPDRIGGVLAVLYLVFNEGYSAAQGDALIRRDLCAEAIRLTRLLDGLLNRDSSDVASLLALMLLHDARREARVDANGDLVLLADQDRSRWNRAEIEEAVELLHHVFRRGLPGSFALEAAIAAVHAESPSAAETDWEQIVGLYDRLLVLHETPVVALNRAVAVSMAKGPAAGLAIVDSLWDALSHYHLWHATRADLLQKLSRPSEARDAFQKALGLTGNSAERRFLQQRIDRLERPPHP